MHCICYTSVYLDRKEKEVEKVNNNNCDKVRCEIKVHKKSKNKKKIAAYTNRTLRQSWITSLFLIAISNCTQTDYIPVVISAQRLSCGKSKIYLNNFCQSIKFNRIYQSNQSTVLARDSTQCITH